MHIKITAPSEDTLADRDYRNYIEIEIDGRKGFSFYDGEPEDANLNRDFKDIYDIPRFLKYAYEAGKNGEPFTMEEVKE